MTSRPTIDGHAHVFRRGLPLAPSRRYAPDYDAPLALYLATLDRNGMSHGVLVQPSFLGTDNSYLAESLAQAPDRLRGVAVVDPGASLDELAALDRAGVVGIRLNLLGRPIPDFDAPHWRAHIEAVRGLGWFVEVQSHAADLARHVVPGLFDRGVRIVLDHFALPDPTAGERDPGWRDLLDYAPSNQVWIKLSAPYRSGPDGPALATRLYSTLRDRFGLDHLVWGSDWPHTQHEGTQSYEKNRLFLQTLVPDKEDRAALLASPRELFRFGA